MSIDAIAGFGAERAGPLSTTGTDLPHAAPSPFLGRPGAVEAQGADAGVAAHYGDPLREQRLIVQGLAAVDLSNRGVLTLTGADRLTWLHSLTTQQLSDLPPRTSRETLLLSPKGHIEYAIHVVDDGERCWLTTEPDSAPPLAQWLDSMRFMLRVQVEDVTDRYAVIGEPVAAESNSDEPPAWVDAWPGPVGDTVTYSPVVEHPARGRAWREAVVPRAELESFVGDRPLAGSWAAEALRVAAWRPRQGAETDHRTIPHELDWLRTAVHLHKGCYRGQETVARVHNLGRPPRRLVFLHLDGSGHTLPAVGAAVQAGDRTVGLLTSVARHYEDGPIALAVIKRNTDPALTLAVDGVSAAQTVVVAP